MLEIATETKHVKSLQEDGVFTSCTCVTTSVAEALLILITVLVRLRHAPCVPNPKNLRRLDSSRTSQQAGLCTRMT